MSFNTDYVSFYDDIYGERDYQGDASYILDALKLSKGKSVVDIGCGTGKLAIALTEYGTNVFGIDPSSAMLSRAAQNIFDAGFESKISLLEGYAVNFSCPKADVASMMFNVAGYLQDDKELMDSLENIHRNLKSKGFLIFDFWNTEEVKREPPAISETVIGHIKRTGYPWHYTDDQFRISYQFSNTRTGEDLFWESHYVRHYEIEHLRECLRQAGFFADFFDKRGGWTWIVRAQKLA